MAQSSKERQLAAIMFTDIAGYTALMGHDEKKAIQILHTNRSLQSPLIEQFGGTWIKEMGDGVLASFTSAYNAVQCAIEIQQKASEDLKSRIRIGIHLGDVTIDGGDVFGDGVNIASRLESIADPGGIYVSEAVYKAIRSNKEINFQFLGELGLKNVATKTGTYSVIAEGLSIPTRNKIKTLSKLGAKKIFYKTPLFYIVLISALLFGSWAFWNTYVDTQSESIRSLAVLPISNFTGDDTQSYFVAGVHDAVIAELGQLGALRVIGKQSTLQYKDSQKTISEIASELHVDALVEASIISISDSIRIQLKLIRAFPEEQQLWSKIYTSKISNILDIYGEIALSIANVIDLKLRPELETRFTRAREVNPDAYQAYLQGQFNMGFLTPEGQQAAMDYFNKAIEIDPDYAMPYAGLMGVWAFSKQMDFVSTEEANPMIEKYIAEALKRDNQSAEIYYWKGIKNIWTDFDFEEGEKSFQRCIELNPNHSLARAYSSHLSMMLKKPDEMRVRMRKALEIDPNNLLIQVLATVELMIEADYDSCINELKRLQTIMPNHPLLMMNLFVCYTETGKFELAVVDLIKMLRQLADETVVETFENAYANSGFQNALNITADTWVSRSDTTFASAQQVTMLYAYGGNVDKAMDWLETGYMRMDPDIPYIGVTPYLRPYHNEPRYLEIMKKMKLPNGK